MQPRKRVVGYFKVAHYQKTDTPAMHPLAIANSQLRPGTDLQRAWSSPSRVNRSRLAQANSRNAAAPTAPITPFLLPGEARNCQLLSSSSQNMISRYSPLFKFAD